MSDIKNVQVPLDEKTIKALKAGDVVRLCGIIYTARDQAHLRMVKMLENKESLPVDFSEQVVYYCGPTPPGDRVIGSCGPTTSSRMDAFTPTMLEVGLKGMIGKGKRSSEVVEAIKANGAVYFIAPGGAGAYLSDKVKACEVVGFEELGPEAIYKLEIEDFPVVVAIDSKGNSIFK